MDFKKICGFVIFLSLVAAPAALRGQKENPGPALTIRQQVDSEILNLFRNVQKVNDRSAKIILIEKTLYTVGVIQNENPKQLSEDEIYINKIVASLKAISKLQDFNNCDEEKLFKNFKSKKQSSIEGDLALEKATDILDEVCSI